MDTDLDYFNKEILPMIEKLKSSDKPNSDVWWEIWDTVHHQGDIYVSSYLSVPKIFEIYEERNWLDFNLPGLLATIENCRQNEKNPKLPEWLKKDYFKSLEKAVVYCAERISKDWDRDLTVGFLMLVCAIKKQSGLFELIDIASSSKEDESYLLELYHQS